MKEDNRPQITQGVIWACRFRVGLFILILCLAGVVRGVAAQNTPMSALFNAGERVDYDLYFKWGILMPKAGLATLSVKEARYEGVPSWHYQLLFRTSGMMEKVFRMRDTIDCHFSPKGKLLFSSKRTDEGDYYLVDNLKFSYRGEKVSSHSHRFTPEVTKIDTVLTTEGYMFDMLGATMYLRAINWNVLKEGDEFPFRIAIGRDLVNVSYRYAGQQIVERGDIKYRTRHFYIDIHDKAFTQSKAAAEVWLGDDENHLPVKIRAKLKIGAAEIYLNSSYNLRYPLASRIVVGRR